jgi:divalent metal cation (Fe/Co/Zn/Cd) transporter
MKSEKTEKKFMPEIPRKEIDELRNSVKTASQKIMAENIERIKKTEIKPLENVTVHIEPSGMAVPAAEVNETQLRKVIYEVANGIGGNLRIKRIDTYAAEGKRYINIDCCFTKQIHIKEAHRIASQVEKETKERFANAVVTVHIEPECP